MKKYDSYKDSGVEWIGEIPSHWGYSIVGRHFEIGRGRVISKIEIEDNKGEFPVYSSQTTNNGELGKINTYDFDGEYVTWTTDGVHTGTCFYRKGKFNTTNVCGMLSIRNTPYSLPFLSFFLNQVTRPYVRIDINPKLMNNMMSEIPLVLPPIHEQQQIVQFLDTKTSLIDSLIEKTQRKIELLKEKRTSLINHVVTKGLNPNVEMKGSGVEWIGEIPSHWKKTKVKYYVNFDSGYSFKSNDYQDKGIPLIRIGSLYQNELSLDRSPIYLPIQYLEEHPLFVVTKNDILISMTGTLGKRDYGYSILYNQNFPSLLNQRVGRLRIKSSKVNLNFLMYTLLSESFLNQLFSKPSGTKQGNLSSDDIIGNHFGLPDIYEQQQIVEYLDEQTSIINTTTTKEQKRIELLKEYRQSLISNVVTGKIKVTTDE
jgi:type I restriction enzyme, S subunit